MTNFMQPDLYGHLTNAKIAELQKLETRGLLEFYVEETKRAYAESFLLDADEAESLLVNSDGTADGQGRSYTGQPTMDTFLAYVERGRG